MPSCRRKGFWRSLRHKCCVAVSLFAYLAAAIGYPLPASAPSGGDRPCSCPALDQCRHQCCCFKPGGRLAGATAWDVELLPHDTKPVEHNSGPRVPGSCCNHGKARSRPACCQSGKHLPACCAKHAPTTPPETPGRVSGAGVRWVPGLSAPSCQGVTTYWVAGGAALPPPPAVSWGPRLDPAGWLRLPDTFTSLLPSIPPDPPPRGSRA